MNESSQKLEAHMVLGLAMVEPFDEGTKKYIKTYIHTYLDCIYRIQIESVDRIDGLGYIHCFCC